MSEINYWNNHFLALFRVSPPSLAINNHSTLKVASVTADSCKTIVRTLRGGVANDRARTRENQNHNPDYNKKHFINQLVICLPNLITNVNKSNKAMMIIRIVAKSLHYLKTNITT